MRSVMILPSLNTMDKPGVQASSTSDVRKLANRCWTTNPKTKTLSQPVQRSGQQGSRPTSIRSLPILPSQKTFNPHVTAPPRTPNQDRHSQRGLRDSHMERFPAIQSQCRTASRQSSLSLPRSDVSRGSKTKRRKPLKRYREVFVWDHRTRTCSEPGINIANETLPSVGTENTLMLATDNHARTLYTPTGHARQKRKQRAQGLLGMLERPLKLDQLCKTPVPNTAWTCKSTNDSPFPSKTIVLPPIGQYEDPGGEESMNGLSEKSMTEQMHKKSVKKMDKGTKSLKTRKKVGKEKLKLNDVEVQHQGTGNGSEYDSDEDTQEDLEDTSGSDSDHDGDEGNSDIGWTDDDDDESGDFLIASRINSQMRKSACSTSQFSRASGITMYSEEIKISGDNGDDDDSENDEDDDENSNDGADDNEDSIDGSQVENKSTDQDDNDDDDNEDDEDEEMEDNNSKDDNSSDAGHEDDDLLSHDMDIENIDDDTMKDSEDSEDEDMFVRISDYGDSEDEIEEENTTAAGDNASENFESEMEGDDNDGGSNSADEDDGDDGDDDGDNDDNDDDNDDDDNDGDDK